MEHEADREAARRAAERARDVPAEPWLPHRLGAHALQLELVPPFAIGLLGPRARLNGDPRLLHGRALDRLTPRLLLHLAEASALALVRGCALLGLERRALASSGVLARGLGGELTGLACVALLGDSLVFELHQLLQGEVDALVTSLGTTGHGHLERSDTRSPPGLGRPRENPSPIGKFRPMPACEADREVARGVEQERVHLHA